MKTKSKRRVVFVLAFFILVGIIVGGVALFTAIRYPLKYEESIIKYSTQYNLDKTLVASLINEESSFNKDAVSRRGAVGLMQLSPATAQFVAESLGEEYSIDKLYDVDTNIRYGCYYLNYLRDKFPSTKVYLSAYNAGETAVRLWLKNKDNSVNGSTLIRIPYRETSEYVSRIIHGKELYYGRI